MKNLSIVSMNGNIMPASDAKISPFDRGLRLGDGLFETIRVRDGRALYLNEHLNRMQSSAVILDFHTAEYDELVRMVNDFLRASGLKEGSLRITLTRGDGEGMWPPKELPTLLVISGAQGVPYPPEAVSKGLTAVVVDEPRRMAGMLSRHKTTSYISSIMARKAAVDEKGTIAILLNQFDRICEADNANIFVVTRKDEIITPPLDEGALPGITRQRLLEAIPDIVQSSVTKEDLYDAQEVVFTNALMPVMPASNIDGQRLRAREFFEEARALLTRSE